MDKHTKDKTLELEPNPEFIYACTCFESSLENVTLSDHKKRILNTVSQTENYLRDRRIPELIRFLLSKVLAVESNKPILYLEKLLDDCMLFRAGVGPAPVLFEDRHLEALVKSFDPGHRGWLTAGQIRKLYATLGLLIKEELPDILPCETILNNVKEAQENELFDLLLGRPTKNTSDDTLV
ncbi:unnamed protein product [Parnassius apollo]|uniref:(apollo) hypothetical protein n=1 Tax=Parnassius apollo TaxID=110799 RepID=A0A8S3WUQ3_PARAO|nr:unnamed protein product [Parnassius apollo]